MTRTVDVLPPGTTPEPRLETDAIGVAQDTVIGMASAAPGVSVGPMLGGSAGRRRAGPARAARDDGGPGGARDVAARPCGGVLAPGHGQPGRDRPRADAAATGSPQGEPAWVDAARVHARRLEGRVPMTCLNIAARHTWATGERARRDAFLYIPRCGQPGRPHLGACHLAVVLPLNGRLLVVAGEHLAASPSHLVTGCWGMRSGM